MKAMKSTKGVFDLFIVLVEIFERGKGLEWDTSGVGLSAHFNDLLPREFSYPRFARTNRWKYLLLTTEVSSEA
jgi:hypothetical protein